MSYINNSSNPEGIRVYKHIDGYIEVLMNGGRGKRLPIPMFINIMKRWYKLRRSTSHKDFRIKENGVKWDLYYKGKLVFSVWEVTLFYLSHHVIKYEKF